MVLQTRATRAWVQGPAVSPSCPVRLGPWSEGPQCRPRLPGDSGPCPSPSSVNQMSCSNPARLRGPRLRPALPGNSGLCPKARGVDQLFRANGSQVRWRPMSTRSPGRRGPVPEGPHGRPAAPGDSDRLGGPVVSTRSPSLLKPLPRPCGANQIFWAIPIRVRGHTESTSCPGTLTLVCEGLRDRPAVPATWAWVRKPSGSTS